MDALDRKLIGTDCAQRSHPADEPPIKAVIAVVTAAADNLVN